MTAADSSAHIHAVRLVLRNSSCGEMLCLLAVRVRCSLCRSSLAVLIDAKGIAKGGGSVNDKQFNAVVVQVGCHYCYLLPAMTNLPAGAVRRHAYRRGRCWWRQTHPLSVTSRSKVCTACQCHEPTAQLRAAHNDEELVNEW